MDRERERQMITIVVDMDEKQELEKIAKESGQVRGERGNISGLVRSIANGVLRVVQRDGHDSLGSNKKSNGNFQDFSEFLLTSREVRILENIYRILFSEGYVEVADEFAKILRNLSNGAFNLVLLEFMEKFDGVSDIKESILKIIDHTKRQEPFKLSYSRGYHFYEFSVFYCEISYRHGRFYLDFWAKERNEEEKIFWELSHNYSVCLEDLLDIRIEPIEGAWRWRLDWITGEIWLFGSAIDKYISTFSDVSDRRIVKEDCEVRRVIRHIFNHEEFVREIISYGEEALVVYPNELREYVKGKLFKMNSLYSNFL